MIFYSVDYIINPEFRNYFNLNLKYTSLKLYLAIARHMNIYKGQYLVLVIICIFMITNKLMEDIVPIKLTQPVIITFFQLLFLILFWQNLSLANLNINYKLSSIFYHNLYRIYGIIILIYIGLALQLIQIEHKELGLTFIYMGLSWTLSSLFSLNYLVPKWFNMLISPLFFIILCILFNDSSTYKHLEANLTSLRLPYSTVYIEDNFNYLCLSLGFLSLAGLILLFYKLSYNKFKYLVLRSIILLFLMLLDIYILTYCGFDIKSKFVEFRPDIWVTIFYLNSILVHLILLKFYRKKFRSFNVKPNMITIVLGLISYIVLFENYLVLNCIVLILGNGLATMLESNILKWKGLATILESNIFKWKGLMLMNIEGPGGSGNNGSNIPGGDGGPSPSGHNTVPVDPNVGSKKRRLETDKEFFYKWERRTRLLFADLNRRDRRIEARNRTIAHRAANPGPFYLSPLTKFKPIVPAPVLDWHSLNATVEKEQTHLRIRPNDCFDKLEYTTENSLEKGVAIDHIINLIQKHKEVGGKRVKSSLFSTCPHIGKFICKHLLHTQPEYAKIHLMDEALEGKIRPVLGRLETPHDKFLHYFRK